MNCSVFCKHTHNIIKGFFDPYQSETKMSKTDLDLYYELAMNIVRDAGQVSLIKYSSYENNKIFRRCTFSNYTNFFPFF